MKNTTNCWVEPQKKCKYLKWQECRRVKLQTFLWEFNFVILIREVPVTNCEPKLVHVPEQEKNHRKKCLLPDKDEQPSYNAPKAAEIPDLSLDLESERLQLRQSQPQQLRQPQQQQSFRQPQQQQAFRQPKQFNNVPQQHQQQRFIPSNRQNSFSG